MRKTITGFALAAVLAVAALAATPGSASAFDFSITFGTGHPPVVRHYDPRPAFPVRPHYDVAPHHRHFDDRPRRHYGRDWRDDRRERRFARDCIVRKERYWDGYSWVTERRRICR